MFLYTLYEKSQTAAVYARPDRLFDIEIEMIFDNYWPCTIFIRPRYYFLSRQNNLIVFRYHLPTQATTFIINDKSKTPLHTFETIQSKI